MPGTEKRTATFRRKVDSLLTLETEQKENVAIFKSTLKIPPKHNGAIPEDQRTYN